MLRILFGARAIYSPDLDDSELAEADCLVVTRDEELFKTRRGPTLLIKTDDHVKWVSIFLKLGLRPLEKSVCPHCGGELVEVDCTEAEKAVGHPIASAACWRCTSCGRYYWVGSHWRRLRQLLDEAAEAQVTCLHTG